MSKPLSSRIERLVRARAEKRHELAILTCASLLVVLSVSLVLHHAGVAMSSPNMELACHYQGSGAHHHNADCYDASGALVCPLNERDLHVHDDSCYTEERTLVCGQEECAGHTHDESCYDAEGNLTCGLEESAGHTHADACYEVTRTLTCGKEEVTEEHVHGPECFAEASVQGVDAALAGQPEPTERASQEPVSDGASDGADQAQPRPARTFEGSLRDANNKVLFKVLVSAPEGALPEGVDLRLAQLDAAAVDEDTVREATAQKADGQLLAYEAVDISFADVTGQVVEPAVPVTVTLGSALVDTDDHVMVVHLDEGDDAARAREAGKVPAEVVDTLGDKALEQREMRLEDDELAFETDRFSPFVLAVTSLRKQMEASDGSSYALAVDAPAEAGIPQDAELEVREIEEGTQEYQQYLAQADEALNVGESEQATDGADLLAEMTVTQQIEAARFFDVSIVVDGQVIEPQAPVQVRVEYLDGPLTLDDESSLKVVHFAEAEGAVRLLGYVTPLVRDAAQPYPQLCANQATDALAAHYAHMAAQQATVIDWHLELPERLPVEETDVCAVLGNLVENALRAVRDLPEDAREVVVFAQLITDAMVGIRVANPFEGTVSLDVEGARQTWQGEHGIGLMSVGMIARRHQGTFEVTTEGGRFCASVLLMA